MKDLKIFSFKQDDIKSYLESPKRLDIIEFSKIRVAGWVLTSLVHKLVIKIDGQDIQYFDYNVKRNDVIQYFNVVDNVLKAYGFNYYLDFNHPVRIGIQHLNEIKWLYVIENDISQSMIELSDYDNIIENQDLASLKNKTDFIEFFRLPFASLSEDKSAVIGKDGFLFINDGSNYWREQLLGDVIISDQRLELLNKSICEYHLQARKRNIKFLFIVIPEKDVIYKSFSPHINGTIPQYRSIHKIISSLPKEMAPIYPEDIMLEFQKKLDLYHRRDSHFNFFGGLIVSNSILEELGYKQLNFNEVATERIFLRDDLSGKWMQNFFTRRRIIKIIYEEKSVENITSSSVRHFFNPKSRTDKTILVYGDSHSGYPQAGITGFLSYHFKSVYFVWSKQIDWSLVDSIKPDSLILESAERFLIHYLR